MTGKAETGVAGETLAEGYLTAKGYRLVERNWRCRAGEIDLVMVDDDVLVFVEVKARRTRSAGSAEEAVSAQKSSRLLAAGDWYVSEHPEYEQMIWRIDLVAITMTPDDGASRVTHIQNAVTAG